MYQVIARKYRPQTFHDVVNQEHVKTTLENAIAQNRIGHGYIFSGQRGTGKTTVARILARCLNCVEGPTATPCGVCPSCVEISAGGSMDVIEIDAASNRGINEMRELRENVRFQPARDRYKIFIIDEAHQITNEAFNALLKTIEEPPEWLFSCCAPRNRTRFRRPSPRAASISAFAPSTSRISSRAWRWICGQEGIEADPEALAVLAQAGEGSVRDSLSALDQAIACCGQKLNAAAVRALLGAFSLESLGQVTAALADSDPRRMLEVVDELERNGHNLQHFSRELARYFRNLLVARIAGSDTRLIAASAAERDRLAQIAARFSEEDLTRYLHLTLELFRDLQFSLQPRFHLEIGLVRLVHAGRLLPIEQALAELGGTESRPAPAAARSGPPPRVPAAPLRTGPSPFEVDRAKKSGLPEPQNSGANALAPAPLPDAGPGERLHAWLTEHGLTHLADAVENARITIVGGDIQILAPKSYHLYLKDRSFAEALREVFSRPLNLKLSAGDSPEAAPQAAPASAGHADEAAGRALANQEVQRFREVFGGEVRRVRNLKEQPK
jgi:DNA polymerase-3 subunit gamma/tau